jgi:hypothetical protein
MTTRLVSTFTLLRACPSPVTIEISTASDAPDASSPGRMPTTRPPAERAPRQAASITPARRPPVTSTQPSRATSVPNSNAAARSASVAAPGPITPIKVFAIAAGLQLLPPRAALLESAKH